MATQEKKTKSNILFVADLPKETTYEDISKFFQDYHFQYAALNNSKSSNVWAQVFLESEEWTVKAKHELNGEILIPKLSHNGKGKPVRICNFSGRGHSNQAEKNIKQNLLVKNLDQRMSQKEFYQLFLKYGEIESAKIEYDDNDISKGYGYIYYATEEGAEKAKAELNSKEFYGKHLDIVNLIPYKSKNINTITLFVINFPTSFDEEDLKRLFEKYGEVKNVSITRNEFGGSKGFGYISFGDFESASKCITDTKVNQISFPGLQPLFVKYAVKKEERDNKKNFNTQINYDFLKIQFNLIFPTSPIKNNLDLEKEIRLFIKVIMLEEYAPKDVISDLESYTGIVTFNNRKDFDIFLQKYETFCLTHQPGFECYPVVPVREAVPPMMGMPPQIPIQGIQNQNFPNGPQNPMVFQQYPPQQIPPQQIPPQQIIEMNQNRQIPPPQPANGFQGFPPGYQGIIPGFSQGQPSQIETPTQSINMSAMLRQEQNSLNEVVVPPPNTQSERNGGPFPFIQLINNPEGLMNNSNQNGGKRNKKQGMRGRMGGDRPGRNINNRFQNKQQNMNQFRQFPFPQMMNGVMPNQMQGIPPNAVNMNQGMPMQQFPMGNINNFNGMNKQVEEIDQRNLQNLNPEQLQSQFCGQALLHPDLINQKEDTANEIADYIYEIAHQIHPQEAAKITGMIKEMGVQKMNLLLSKNEDLLEMIEKGYEMIKDSEQKSY